jgi:membrane protein implicated in regulation of membrane protease activity
VSWGRTKYMIQVEGELWTVLSKDNLQPGNRVIITALRGNTPVVERKDTGEVL